MQAEELIILSIEKPIDDRPPIIKEAPRLEQG